MRITTRHFSIAEIPKTDVSDFVTRVAEILPYPRGSDTTQ